MCLVARAKILIIAATLLACGCFEPRGELEQQGPADGYISDLRMPVPDMTRPSRDLIPKTVTWKLEKGACQNRAKPDSGSLILDETDGVQSCVYSLDLKVDSPLGPSRSSCASQPGSNCYLLYGLGTCRANVVIDILVQVGDTWNSILSSTSLPTVKANDDYLRGIEITGNSTQLRPETKYKLKLEFNKYENNGTTRSIQANLESLHLIFFP